MRVAIGLSEAVEVDEQAAASWSRACVWGAARTRQEVSHRAECQAAPSRQRPVVLYAVRFGSHSKRVLAVVPGDLVLILKRVEEVSRRRKEVSAVIPGACRYRGPPRYVDGWQGKYAERRNLSGYRIEILDTAEAAAIAIGDRGGNSHTAGRQVIAGAGDGRGALERKQRFVDEVAAGYRRQLQYSTVSSVGDVFGSAGIAVVDSRRAYEAKADERLDLRILGSKEPLRERVLARNYVIEVAKVLILIR